MFCKQSLPVEEDLAWIATTFLTEDVVRLRRIDGKKGPLVRLKRCVGWMKSTVEDVQGERWVQSMMCMSKMCTDEGGKMCT
jgi:hypothetical protein